MTTPNGHDDGQARSNVASLAEARQRAAEKAKAEKRTAAAGGRGQRTARDWIIGGIVVVMAISYIASFFVGAPQMAAGVATGGVQ